MIHANLLFSQIFVKTMKTRMHSSRMRTARSLTIIWGGVRGSGWGDACFRGGMCASGWGHACFRWGCMLPGEGGACIPPGGGVRACLGGGG